jgi:hypothetical protein
MLYSEYLPSGRAISGATLGQLDANPTPGSEIMTSKTAPNVAPDMALPDGRYSE